MLVKQTIPNAVMGTGGMRFVLVITAYKVHGSFI